MSCQVVFVIKKFDEYYMTNPHAWSWPLNLHVLNAKTLTKTNAKQYMQIACIV